MRGKRIIEILVFLSAFASLIASLYNITKDLDLAIYGILVGVGLIILLIVIRFHKPYGFESLSNDIVFDICDKSGSSVLYSKISIIRRLRKGALYYVEDMSADGSLDQLEVFPGKIVSVKEEEGKILVKTTFGRPTAKGEEFTRTFKCRFNDSFCEHTEYWVERQNYPTKEFCLTFLFPKDRLYKTFKAVKKIGTYEVKCQKPIETMVSSRAALVLKIRNPSLKDSYKLEWTW